MGSRKADDPAFWESEGAAAAASATVTTTGPRCRYCGQSDVRGFIRGWLKQMAKPEGLHLTVSYLNRVLIERFGSRVPSSHARLGYHVRHHETDLYAQIRR